MTSERITMRLSDADARALNNLRIILTKSTTEVIRQALTELHDHYAHSSIVADIELAREASDGNQLSLLDVIAYKEEIRAKRARARARKKAKAEKEKVSASTSRRKNSRRRERSSK